MVVVVVVPLARAEGSTSWPAGGAEIPVPDVEQRPCRTGRVDIDGDGDGGVVKFWWE